MSDSRTHTRGLWLLLTGSVGAIATMCGVASAEAIEPELPVGTYRCEPLSPENFAEKPPDLSSEEGPQGLRLDDGVDALGMLERQFADESKLNVSPCPKGMIAYPSGLAGPSNESNDDDVPPVLPTPPYTVPHEKYRHVGASWERVSMGGFVRINVANPNVPSEDHSIGQLAYWTHWNAQILTVEAGWVKRSTMTAPQLFTYVNKDSYKSHGEPGGDCYNCHFVPAVGSQYIPGQTLVPSEHPYEDVTLEFGTMRYQGNWWIWVGDQWIGYLEGSFWPSSSFNYSTGHDYYGEVYDEPTSGLPEMGNGTLGSSPNGSSSVMKTPSYMTVDSGSYSVHQESVNDANADLFATYQKNYNFGDVGAGGRFWRFGGPNPS